MNTPASNIDNFAPDGYVKFEVDTGARAFSHFGDTDYFGLMVSTNPMLGIPINYNMHLVADQVEEAFASWPGCTLFLNSLPDELRPLVENCMRESLAKHFLRVRISNNLRGTGDEQYNHMLAIRSDSNPKLTDYDKKILIGKM